MATFTVRDVPEGIAATIRQQATSAGLSTEAYVRQLLHSAATQATAKQTYRIRAYDLNNEGASMQLSRDPSGISGMFARDCSPAQIAAYQKAKDLVVRNLIGDRETAIAILRGAFEEVFEA